MSRPFEGPTRNAQETKGAELEQEQSRLQEELVEGRLNASPILAEEEQARPQTRARPHRSSRRKMLTKGVGVAAVASVGAGALLELSGGTSRASGPRPGVFASNKAGTPAVKATGTNGADGVDATSDSGTGVSGTGSTGVHGTGTGTGVIGTGNVGVSGTSTSNNGTSSVGVSGFSTNTNGIGVWGVATGTGSYGVQGTGSTGVIGTGSPGVSGFSNSSSGTGVTGTASSGTGVAGFSTTGSGTGVFGSSSGGDGVRGSSGTNASGIAGVHGQNTAGGFAGLFDGNVLVNGNFSATGTKSFVQAHPTDPGKEIVYVALEGGEAGTYVRGSSQLKRGKAVIALPEHFGLVTATSGLTVQLTPRGEWLQLYVAELGTTQLVVREAQGKSGVFDYFICGVRSGYEQHEVIRTKRQA